MYTTDHKALVAISRDRSQELVLLPSMASRHGLITGATGTGKTVTLQTLAETFSQMGTAVFAADIKGDLSGVAATGGNKSSVVKRVEDYQLQDKGFVFQASPVQFWDVSGEQGTPVRTTVSSMGPLLFGRLLSLNDTQSAVLVVLFKIAEDEKLVLVTLKDLQKLLEYSSANIGRYTATYGNITIVTLGIIQRGLLILDQEGVGQLFGEPSLVFDDLIRTENGKGIINILVADKLVHSPRVYTIFLLWLMTQLFIELPEAGEVEKPKLVFFFDEAHLLFNDAPVALLEKVEQTVRLIRSKGVGIYFISQNPSDMPDSVLGQLGNRVQHALRAYTPNDQKYLKAAAKSFRSNPDFDTETAIAELETGEALVSFLDAKGAPEPVQRAFIIPPQGQLGPLDPAVRVNIVQASPMQLRYSTTVKNAASAHDQLLERMNNTLSEKQQAEQVKLEEKAYKEQEKIRKEEQKNADKADAKSKKMWNRVVTSFVIPIAKKLIIGLIKKPR